MNGLKLFFLIPLMSFAAFTKAADYPAKIYHLTDSANKINYSETEKKISSLVKNHNNNPYVYCARSAFYYKFNQEELALKDISTAIELIPEKYDFFEARCQLYMSYERYDEAFKDINSMFRMDSTIPDPYIYRGNYYFNTDNLHVAFENYDKAIGIFEKNHAHCHIILNSYYFRGELNLAFGNADKAIEDFSKIINLTKDHVHAGDYYMRALAYAVKGDSFNMRHDIDSSLSQKPDNGWSVYIYALKGDTLNTGKMISASILKEKMPWEKPYDKNYRLARYYAVANQKEKAFKYLEEALLSGYKSFNWIKADYMLNNIRNTPEYTALIEKYEKK
ncbi:MAG: hypothetical protein JWN78_3212 [Bacteroidota bacterium]|nr:hypothetical protein [Bacteroidota bacterium]